MNNATYFSLTVPINMNCTGKSGSLTAVATTMASTEADAPTNVATSLVYSKYGKTLYETI